MPVYVAKPDVTMGHLVNRGVVLSCVRSAVVFKSTPATDTIQTMSSVIIKARLEYYPKSMQR